jgi:hypothetical protein
MRMFRLRSPPDDASNAGASRPAAKKAGQRCGRELSANADHASPASAAHVIKARHLKRLRTSHLLPTRHPAAQEFGGRPLQGAVGILGTKLEGCKS